MPKHDIPEGARFTAFNALDIPDTPTEDRFDRFIQVATCTFDTLIALISLVDDGLQWFKSPCGLYVEQTPRSMAFCRHAVATGSMFDENLPVCL